MNTIEVTSPFDGKVVGEVKFSSIANVQNGIDLAQTTFLDQNNSLPKYERIRILEKVVKIMSSQVEELTILCASEGGKPLMDTRVEVDRAIDGVLNCIDCAR